MCYSVPCRAMELLGQSFIKSLPRSSLFFGSDRRWEKHTIDENEEYKKSFLMKQRNPSVQVTPDEHARPGAFCPVHSALHLNAHSCSYAIHLTWHSVRRFELVYPSCRHSDALQGPMIILSPL